MIWRNIAIMLFMCLLVGAAWFFTFVWTWREYRRQAQKMIDETRRNEIVALAAMDAAVDQMKATEGERDGTREELKVADGQIAQAEEKILAQQSDIDDLKARLMN